MPRPRAEEEEKVRGRFKVSTKTRKRAAVLLLLLCLVAWPVTAMTVFREEPQGILGLSWAAIILTMLDIVATADVRDND